LHFALDFKKHGFSDRTRVEDLDLTWTLLAHGYKVRFAPRCIVYPQECRHLRDEWRKWRRWIVGYAVCMRLHKHSLLTRFGIGSIFPMFAVVWFGTISYANIWIAHAVQGEFYLIPLSVFPLSWIVVVFLLAGIQSWRHKNIWLPVLAPLSVLHVLMTYVVWIVHGIAGFFTGREPERDKPTRYVQIMGEIKKTLHIQPPGILHFEVHHLAHGKGCLLLAIDSVTQWISALHVQDNSQDSFSTFFYHVVKNYPVKVRKIVAFNNPDGQSFQANCDVHQFCRLARVEYVFVHAQKIRKSVTQLLQALQEDAAADLNKKLQFNVQLHNNQLPLKVMQSWYARNPKIFIEEPRKFSFFSHSTPSQEAVVLGNNIK